MSEEEKKKISHAEKFFSGLSQGITVKFQKQLIGKKIIEVIQGALAS